MDAAIPLDLGGWPSLEAQVAALADDIAYDNHDIDDGLRAGLIDLDEVVAQPLVAPGWAAVRARYPDLPAGALVAELVREQIGRMVNDLLAETRAAIAAAGIASADDARRAGRALVCFSPAVAADERAFKRFMYARLYHHPSQLAVASLARGVIAGLAGAYRADPRLLPPHWRERLPDAEPGRARHIADFIAGMTDRYALARYRALIGPVELGEGA